ncbi:hypothetical protein ACET89_16680, partial [Aeromonas veronii]
MDKTINSSQMSNMLGLKSAEKQGWPQTEEGIGGKEYEEIFLEIDRCKKSLPFQGGFLFNGADTQNRTGDLILTKDALYRLSHI